MCEIGEMLRNQRIQLLWDSGIKRIFGEIDLSVKPEKPNKRIIRKTRSLKRQGIYC